MSTPDDEPPFDRPPESPSGDESDTADVPTRALPSDGENSGGANLGGGSRRGYIGRYKILRELGRGGMGQVWLAVLPESGRCVAVKLPLGDGDAVLGRFYAEIDAMRCLSHSNIVSVLEIGEQNGLPYLVLEYCAGQNLRQLLRSRPLTPREAAAVACGIARAAHCAHQSRIVHRDLKPENVLVAAPAVGAVTTEVVKVTDFGIAKFLETVDDMTYTYAELGTLRYMAPEQARKPKDAGASVDIWGIGVILYETLTGNPPFSIEQMRAMAHGNQRIDPPPIAPRGDLPRDLVTVCLKCLHADPRDRYADAAALAADLEAVLEGTPVAARPMGRVAKVRRWGRENRTFGATLAMLALATTSALAIGVAYQFRNPQPDAAVVRAAQEKMDAASAAEKAALADAKAAQVKLAAIHVDTANTNFKAGKLREALAGLRSVPDDYRTLEWGLLYRRLLGSDAVVTGHAAEVNAVACRFDGAVVASADAGGTIRLWDGRDHRDVGELRGEAGELVALAYSPDGKRLAAARDDGGVDLWDVAAKSVRTLAGHSDSVRSVDFSRDGKRLVTASRDGTARVWEVETGKCVTTFQGSGVPLNGAAFQPDGERVASVGDERAVRVWNPNNGKQVVEDLVKHIGNVLAVAYSPNGSCFATAGDDKTVFIWESVDGGVHQWLSGAAAPVTRLAFRPDCDFIAGAAGDGTVYVWRARLWSQEKLIEESPYWKATGHLGAVRDLAYETGGERLVTGGADRTVRFWNARTWRNCTELDQLISSLHSVAVSPDGTRIAAGGALKEVAIWDAFSGEEMLRLKGHTGAVKCVAFTPDGTRLVSASVDKTVRIWNAKDGTELKALTGHTDSVYTLAVSPDGKRIAAGGKDTTVRIWDALSGELLSTFKQHAMGVHCLAFSPDGRKIVSAGSGGVAYVWEVASQQIVARFKGHKKAVMGIAFHPEGRSIVSAGDDQVVECWDAATGASRWSGKGHTNNVHCVAFTPDGSRVVSGGRDGTLRIWDAASGLTVLTIEDSWQGKYNAVAVGPDGKRIVAANGQWLVQIWDSRPPEAERLERVAKSRPSATWHWKNRQGMKELPVPFPHQFHAEWLQKHAPRLAAELDEQRVRLWK